ncbi:MAG: hypothetical protein KDD24_03960 [Flavobacteriales bacterium]|nr:hypothetical protein [Flavobacteriales bacterium]
MNKKYGLLFLFIMISSLTFACDLCSVYIGIQPQDFKSSFGLRYRYRLFEERVSKISSKTISTNSSARLQTNNNYSINHLNEETSTTNNYLYTEQYNSVDLVLNVFFGKKLNVLITNSFSDNYVYHNDSIIDNISGFGDLNVITNYRIINTKISTDSLAKNKFLHRLTIGLGVELPTGSFNKQSVKGYETSFTPSTIIGKPLMELDEHLQAGTGSFNYLFLMEYLLKYNGFGLNTNASYKVFTENKNNFRFANRYNFNSSLFYLFDVTKNIKFMPHSGINYEVSMYDKDNKKDVMNTGGESAFMNAGVNWFIKNLAIDFTYYRPVYQNLFGNQPSNKERIITQITYYF